MYATIAQLKNELGIAAADTSQDAYLSDLLAQVSAWIDTYTGRRFGPADASLTEEHEDVHGSLWLRNVGVTVTKVETRDKQSDTWNVVYDYTWRSTGRVTGVSANFVRFTYTLAGGIPRDIEGAALALAARAFRVSSIKRESIGDYEVEYQPVQDVAEAAQGFSTAVLDAYHLRNV